MRFTFVVAAGSAALALAAPSLAAPESRQFTHSIGTYARSVDDALRAAKWRTTGTKCEFRSGRTLVYCYTPDARRKGTRERIETTMRRVSSSKIRIRIKFLNSAESGIPKLVRASVQVSTVPGS